MMNRQNRLKKIDVIVTNQKSMLDYKNILKKINSIKNTDYQSPLSLSSGLPSLLLFYQELEKNYTNIDLHEQKHNLVKILSNNVRFIANNDSLFDGLAGIGFAIQYLSNSSKNYSNILDTLDARIRILIENRIATYNKEDIINPKEYDVIFGTSGIMRYLMERPSRDNMLTIQKILPYFYYSTTQEWRILPKFQFLDEEKKYFKEGNINFGLAHGMLGPTTIMALYQQKNPSDSRNKKELLKSYNLLKKYGQKQESGFSWPMRYDFYRGEGIFTTRNGWCYGDNGIYNTIYLIGKALNDNEILKTAESILPSIIEDNYENMISPTFCHGLSGKAAFMLLQYFRTQDAVYLNRAETIIDNILVKYNSNNIFGFQDVEDNIDNIDDSPTYWDNFGLLTGSIGVYLVLMEYTSLMKENRIAEWNKIFLLI
ncbi:MAG: lanthionine synthetase C family protein [Lactobacillaceae bacterium]